MRLILESVRYIIWKQRRHRAYMQIVYFGDVYGKEPFLDICH